MLNIRSETWRWSLSSTNLMDIRQCSEYVRRNFFIIFFFQDIYTEWKTKFFAKNFFNKCEKMRTIRVSALMGISKNWDQGPETFGTTQDPRLETNFTGLIQDPRPCRWNPRSEIRYLYCIWCPRSVTWNPKKEKRMQDPRLETLAIWETLDCRPFSGLKKQTHNKHLQQQNHRPIILDVQ